MYLPIRLHAAGPSGRGTPLDGPRNATLRSSTGQAFQQRPDGGLGLIWVDGELIGFGYGRKGSRKLFHMIIGKLFLNS